MIAKEVRDLEWVLRSPTLLTQQAEWPDTGHIVDDTWSTEWIAALKANPSPLLKHQQKQTSHFLGSYFESLWAFYLSAHPHIELIAKNLQVRTLKKTIGEFDFIIFDKVSEKFIHQEIAIKFYLGFSHANNHPFTDGNSLWLGPQCRDRLDLKVGKLINSQTRLSQNEFGIRTLRKLGIENITSQAIMKGYLFYPRENNVAAPTYCNTDHLRGAWLRAREIQGHPDLLEASAPSTHLASGWKILSKSHWVSPFTIDLTAHSSPGENDDFFTDQQSAIESIVKKVSDENRPWMIASLAVKDRCYIEVHRVFVVPDHWPDIDSYPLRP